MARRTNRMYNPFRSIETAAAADAGEVMDEEAEQMVLDYWDEDRMANAKPIPLPVALNLGGPAGGAPSPRDMVDAALSGSGSGFVPPTPPFEAVPAFSGNFSSRRVTNLGAFPYSIAGKLFMNVGGQDAAGSAWVIGNRAICTAGHCVFSSGRPAQNVMFEPQFLNGQSLGRFAISQTAAPKEWTANPPNFAYDIGMGISKSPLPIGQTGKAGYPTGPYQPGSLAPFLSVGYPGRDPRFPVPPNNPGFTGQEMWECTGSLVKHPSFPDSGSGPVPFGLRCDFVGGASGGPIFASVQGVFHVVGLNSHTLDTNPATAMFSPYLGDGFLKLVQWMINNGGDSGGDTDSPSAGSVDGAEAPAGRSRGNTDSPSARSGRRRSADAGAVG